MPEAAWDAIIVGAGFGGLAMTRELQRIRGLRFLVLEKAHRLGGTWRDNTYPGCACDIPSHLYSLSFAPNPAWSRMFASQPEILSYMDEVAGRIGLGAHLRLGVAVRAAHWDDASSLWRLELDDGSTLAARNLICAMGPLHHPSYPDIPGLADFAGPSLHTAKWDHTLPIAGSRIGVIGTGASAIQIVPELAKTAAQLMVFQRTPPWIAPKFDRPIKDEERRTFARSRLAQRHFRGQLWWAHEKRAAGFTSQDPKVVAQTEALCRRHLHKQVKDAALRAKLTPDYTVGCKRLLISNDWYPALQRPDVALVTTPIRRIAPHAVIDAQGATHPLDILVFGTGFDAQGALSRVPILGAEGRSLQTLWDTQGRSAYLGTTVNGFPNLFLMTGPNAGSGHTSQVFMLEAQAHYIARAIATMRARRASRMEIRPEAQARFRAEMEDRLRHSVWQGGGCQSWYLDRKGRNTVLWPSLSIDFWWRTRRVRHRDYAFAASQ
jgi:cation diffusion facilitator CzcD-associated flavoprotein CzcO